jgi:hypothetical protein
MLNVTQARKKLKAAGWTYRTAAPVLGVTYSWMGRVLTGKQTSEPLLSAIAALPTFDEWRKAHEQPTEA